VLLTGVFVGAIETLMLWENLAVTRFELKNPDDRLEIKFLRPDQESDDTHFKDAVSYVASCSCMVMLVVSHKGVVKAVLAENVSMVDCCGWFRRAMTWRSSTKCC
jgi:peptide subunit release factor 1 (eRF1)